MALTASTAQWTEPEASGVSVRLTRAFLVKYGDVYVFSREGPASATLSVVAPAAATRPEMLGVDDDVAHGRRLATDADGRLILY